MSGFNSRVLKGRKLARPFFSLFSPLSDPQWDSCASNERRNSTLSNPPVFQEICIHLSTIRSCRSVSAKLGEFANFPSSRIFLRLARSCISDKSDVRHDYVGTDRIIVDRDGNDAVVSRVFRVLCDGDVSLVGNSYVHLRELQRYRCRFSDWQR